MNLVMNGKRLHQVAQMATVVLFVLIIKFLLALTIFLQLILNLLRNGI